MSKKNELKLSSKKKKIQKTPSVSFLSRESSSSSSPEFVTIYIEIYNFENLEYLTPATVDDNSEVEFKIVAKYLNVEINSSSMTRFRAYNKNSLNITFNIQIDVNKEEEIFNLRANPLLLSLQQHDIQRGEEMVLGNCNIDMLALCSTHKEEISCKKLCFEKTHNSHFRKLSFDCRLSNDKPLLKAPYENILFITFDSIHNFDIKDEITFNFQAPLSCQFTKALNFTKTFTFLNHGDVDEQQRSHKQWFNLCNRTESGSQSIYQNEAYTHPLKCEEEALLSKSHSKAHINAMMRVILFSDTKQFLYNHIRNGMIFAVELMHNNEHMIGFIDAAEELMHVERRRIRVVIPLYKFNNEVMLKRCGYESSLLSLSKSRGSKEMRNEYEAILNDCGDESFIVVELELEKALNEEIYEDSREALTSPYQVIALKCSDSDEKISSLKRELQGVVEMMVDKKLNVFDAISNAEIKHKLIPQFLHLTTINSSSSSPPTIDANLFCKLSSKLLNENRTSHAPLMNDQRKLLLAKFYEALGMGEKADEILLQEIVKNRESEKVWINCAIHYMRRQCYDKSTVCIDEVLRINEISFLGKILKEYLNLKIGKEDENCGENGLKIQKRMKNFLTLENQPDFKGLINNVEEIVWNSKESEKLLSCQDNYIKIAITFIKLGCYDIAEDAIGMYYSNYGVNINYFYLLAAVDAQKKNHSNALKHLNRIASVDIGNHHVNYIEILVSICINLMLNNQHENAVDLFNKFITLDGCDNILLLFLLGRHHYQHQMYENAIGLLTKSSQIFPCELTFNELAKTHEKLNNLELAEKNFQLAVNYACLHAGCSEWKNLCAFYERHNRNFCVKENIY